MAEVPIDLTIVGGSSHSDKGKSPQVIGSTDDAPRLSKAVGANAILRSIQDLFTSWEQAKGFVASRSSSASRPVAPSAAFSEENMNMLKQSVLEYVTFMDMGIVKASASDQKDKIEVLGAKMAQALELPSLEISSSLKMSLKLIYSEISSLLAKNVELKAQTTQYIQVVAERESLFDEIEKSKGTLNEISSEIMVEDSLMMKLVAEMKELQARMDDCKARLTAMERAAFQEVERSQSLVERYVKLEVNEEIAIELPAASQKQLEEWEQLREQMRAFWGNL